VGLVPAASEEVTRALADGARLALEQAQARGGPALELVVGRQAGGEANPWATATASIVELAEDRGALALITPPERATAHLMAQIGTRSHVPVISTSCAASVTATGSWWVVSVAAGCPPGDAGATEPLAPAFDPESPASAPFRTAFRARFSREPGAWAAAGYNAAAVAAEAARRGGLSREQVVEVLREGFSVQGAEGLVGLAESAR
jgi:ABC-type branched-subunit amino acid transport system substrate-binding protein